MASFAKRCTRHGATYFHAQGNSKTMGLKLETKTTVQKALRHIAEAGGTIKSMQFARVMWPPNDPGWRDRPKKKRTVSPEARMIRRASLLLGRLAGAGHGVHQAGPQTWSLTPDGWRMLSAAYSQPSAAVPMVTERHYVWGSDGQWHAVKAVTEPLPPMPGYKVVTWLDGKPYLFPTSYVRTERISVAS
jgi:hypothetical protein